MVVSGVDIMVLDVYRDFTELGDSFDGHFGNMAEGDDIDDGAVDIMLVEGDKGFDGQSNSTLNDRIVLRESVQGEDLRDHEGNLVETQIVVGALSANALAGTVASEMTFTVRLNALDLATVTVPAGSYSDANGIVDEINEQLADAGATRVEARLSDESNDPQGAIDSIKLILNSATPTESLVVFNPNGETTTELGLSQNQLSSLEPIPALGGQILVEYNDARFEAIWLSRNPDGSLRPLVEQFQLSGLMGDDTVSVQLDEEAVTLLEQNTPGNPWVAVVGGGPGNDILTGSPGRDRLDGGPGSDFLFGFGGDDRLWGDTANGDPFIDKDYLFAGAGADDLIGGMGENEIFAWSYHPLAVPDGNTGVLVADFFDDDGNLLAAICPSPDDCETEFGVFVDSTTGELITTGGDWITESGDADGDGFLDADGVSDPYVLEDTGLNRMLGASNELRRDIMYAGTGLDFLYGNGGGGPLGDQIITPKGTEFEDTDGELGQDDDWKQYAKTTDKVWYVNGSATDDNFVVDFVTDPYSALFNRHLVLVNQGGTTSVRFRFGNNAPEDSTGEALITADDIFSDTQEICLRSGPPNR